MRKSLLSVMLLILMMTGFVNSAPVAEYCAEILNDSTYRPLLIKDLNEPIKEWNYPETYPTISKPEWVTKAKLDFPHDIECHSGRLEKHGCGNSSKWVRASSNSEPRRKLERIEKMKLQGGVVWGPDSCVRNQWVLHNARESLKNFYGKIFDGVWIGEWNHGDRMYMEPMFPPMQYSYGAKLVGECTESIPALEYCVVGDKSIELHLTNSFENVPMPSLADINGEATTMDCEGLMRMEKSLEMDFGKKGKRELVHALEQDTCHVTSKVSKKIYIPIPRYIPSTSLKGISAKNLYGKIIPLVSKNALKCNFETIKRDIRFSARIVGPCDSLDLQKREKFNVFELRQVGEMRSYGRFISSGECVEMKDLLK